jgi:hypothetical protein
MLGRTSRLFGGIAVALSLGACGGIEGDLLDAVNANDATPLCVAPQMIGVDFFEGNDGNRYFAGAGEVSFTQAMSNISALEDLVNEGYAEEEVVSMPAGFARYVDVHLATDKMDPFAGEYDNLCIGSMHATEIIEYTEPGDGGQQMVEARFKYDIEFNELIDDLGLEDALIDGPVGANYPGEGTGAFVKTNKGWRMEYAQWIN